MDKRLPTSHIVACGARPNVPLCIDCIKAYRNGIEPGTTECDVAYDARTITVRVDEQVATVVEISYHVQVPIDFFERDLDIEDFISRANDEIHRETVRYQCEITNTEPING